MVPIRARFTAANALALIAEYDVIADGSDNFETRFLVNDASYLAGKPLVSAAILRFDGQLSTYKAHLGGPNPCYRCIFPEAPPPGLIPRAYLPFPEVRHGLPGLLPSNGRRRKVAEGRGQAVTQGCSIRTLSPK